MLFIYIYIALDLNKNCDMSMLGQNSRCTGESHLTLMRLRAVALHS